MLDRKMLEDMPPGTIFATGFALDVDDELFIAGTGQKLRWIAIRGHGPADWCIYCHREEWTIDEITREGEKAHEDKNIRHCVPCDDEALACYRH